MSFDLKQLAELGAQTRVDQLTAELDAIRKAYPHITTGGFRGAVKGKAAAAPVVGVNSKGKKTTMSEEARARISKAQKARWANAKKAASDASEKNKETLFAAPEAVNPEVAEAVQEVQTASEPEAIDEPNGNTVAAAPAGKKRSRGTWRGGKRKTNSK